MFCKHCGADLKDDSTAFCPSCGKRLIQTTQATNTNTNTDPNPSVSFDDTTTTQSDNVATSSTKTKSKSKRVITIVIAILLLCGILEAGIYCGYKVYYKHNINKYIEYVSSNDYSSANALYYGKLSNNNQYVTEVIQRLNEYLYSIRDDMYKDNKSYEDCLESLNTVNALGIEYLSDSILDTKTYLDEVQQNNSLVAQADECFDSEDYINAIRVYSMVTENTSNYDSIKDKISQCESRLVEQTTEYSQTAIADGDYAKAISLINDVYTVVPDSSELDSLFESVKADYRQYFIDSSLQKAKDSVSSKDEDTMLTYLGELYDGISLYDDILSDKNVKEANETILNGIRELLNGYIKKSNADKAINLLNSVSEVLPEEQFSSFDDIQAQVVNLIKEHSDRLISENKDYSGALEYLKTMYESNPDNEDIKQLYESMFSKRGSFESVWNGTIATSKGDGVTLRESASTDSEEVTRIADGKTVSVSEEFGEWYKVNYNGNDGYILKEYVKNYG